MGDAVINGNVQRHLVMNVLWFRIAITEMQMDRDMGMGPFFAGTHNVSGLLHMEAESY